MAVTNTYAVRLIVLAGTLQRRPQSGKTVLIYNRHSSVRQNNDHDRSSP
jgi:hypothetical protein